LLEAERQRPNWNRGAPTADVAANRQGSLWQQNHLSDFPRSNTSGGLASPIHGPRSPLSARASTVCCRACDQLRELSYLQGWPDSVQSERLR